MNISIFYFSGTGNTWWVAQKITEIFQEKGHEAKSISIEKEGMDWEKALPEILKDADIIGIGFPVYGSSIPMNMENWVKNYLCNVEDSLRRGMRGFVFDTMAMFSGDTPLLMRKILKKCGIPTQQAINIRMLCNLPQMPSLMTWDKDEQDALLEKAKKKCHKLVDNVLQDKKWVMRRDPFTRFIAWIQRVGMKLEGKKIKELFQIDHDKCNLCGLCVKFCPVNNLSIEETEEKAKVKYGDDCVYCVRCFDHCPQDAIIIMKRTRDTEKYRRFRNQIPGFKLKKLR